MKTRYEVDEAMIGGDEPANVGAFCEILQELLDEHGIDVDAVPIVDSFNGANNGHGAGSTIPETVWNEAQKRYFSE